MAGARGGKSCSLAGGGAAFFAGRKCFLRIRTRRRTAPHRAAPHRTDGLANVCTAVLLVSAAAFSRRLHAALLGVGGDPPPPPSLSAPCHARSVRKAPGVSLSRVCACVCARPHRPLGCHRAVGRTWGVLFFCFRSWRFSPAAADSPWPIDEAFRWSPFGRPLALPETVCQVSE